MPYRICTTCDNRIEIYEQAYLTADGDVLCAEKDCWSEFIKKKKKILPADEMTKKIINKGDCDE